MELFINIGIGFIVVVLIIYICGSIKTQGSIVKTIWQNGNEKIVAEQVYYLPAAVLLIKATAKVIVTKNETTGNIINAKLAELALDTTIQHVPDTRNALVIEYIPSTFSNDDLKFSISSYGLIEGCNITTEDRISHVISQLAEAPKMILSGEQAVASKSSMADQEILDGDTIISETKEYTNNFWILSEEIRAKIATRIWQINVDGKADTKTTVDASVTLKFDIPVAANSFLFNNKSKEFDGILMRPLQTVIMNVYKDPTSPAPDIQYQIILPDESRVVSIPIKRSAFVKKMYGFKISNGVLTENIINKPSEMEGFISIPIKIAKAIISIPVQLISFRFDNIKRQTALETEQQNLAKLQLQTRKDEIAKESDLFKAKIDSQKIILTYEGEIAKTKLEAEKTLIIAQKDVITANKDLTAAKKDWQNTKKELEEILKKIEDEHENKYKN